MSVCVAQVWVHMKGIWKLINVSRWFKNAHLSYQNVAFSLKLLVYRKCDLRYHVVQWQHFLHQMLAIRALSWNLFRPSFLKKRNLGEMHVWWYQSIKVKKLGMKCKIVVLSQTCIKLKSHVLANMQWANLLFINNYKYRLSCLYTLKKSHMLIIWLSRF